MRILIATVTAGAGHLQAATAIEEAWRAFRPRDTLERLDVLDFTPRFYKKAYAEGYIKLIEHAPELYALFFKKTDNPALIRKLTRLRRALSRFSTKSFVRYLQRFKPDVVICPHFLPLEILGSLKAKAKSPFHPLIVCVVTDFEAHALWMEPCVDLYCVAAEETKGRLVARGASSNHIAVTGIPVSARFSAKLNVRGIRKHYGLRDDLPTLLVLGGGFGMGPVEKILNELNKLELAVQIMVVAGRNEKLKRNLAAQDWQHPTRILGFVNNMHELMALADLIITKPGGLTTSEALALGKPLFILNPIPGQEAANSDFLLERGAAIKANCIEDLPFRLSQLLNSKKLSRMARAAKSLGHPYAARDICAKIFSLIKNRT